MRAGAADLPAEQPATIAPASGASGTTVSSAGESVVAIRCQPFSVSSSSTAIVERVPEQDDQDRQADRRSAAATVRMKNTNTCPAMSPR